MKKLKFISPTIEHEKQMEIYIKEHKQNNEHILHGGAFIEDMTYTEWLMQLENNSKKETVNPNLVVSSTFLASVDEEIVGMINIRHYLNDTLKNFGGHIGYGIRPSQRKNGYAPMMLEKALDYCRQLDLKEVILTCHKINKASSKTIEKCGGVLSREYLHTDNEIIQVYQIKL